MRRELAVRRGGAVGTTSGVVAVAGSSALMLAVGPRLLGAHAFSGLALAWTVSAVFGFGLAAPTEQLINRRLNARAPHAIRPPMAALAVLSVLAAAACVGVGLASPTRHEFRPLAASMVVAVAGWFVLTYVRGRLAGAGDLRMYTVVLGTEAAARCVFIVIAAAARPHAAWWLGAAIGVPLFVAAAVGAIAHVEPIPQVPTDGRRLLTSDQVAFVVVSVGFQTCLNAPALLVAWRAGSKDTIGAFVAANTYFRAPTILMGGIATYALVALSHAWGNGDIATFRAVVRRSLRTAVLITAATIAVIAVLEPVLLPFYYGRNPHLRVLLLAAMAVSSVLAVVAGIAVQPLLALGRDAAAATAWATAGVITTSLVAISDGTDALAAVGLVAGPLAAVLVAAAALRRAAHGEAA